MTIEERVEHLEQMLTAHLAVTQEILGLVKEFKGSNEEIATHLDNIETEVRKMRKGLNVLLEHHGYDEDGNEFRPDKHPGLPYKKDVGDGFPV